MTVELHTVLLLRNEASSYTLADLFAAAFPEGTYGVSTSGSLCRFSLDLQADLPPADKALLMDFLRLLDEQVAQPVYVTGKLGGDRLAGYLGPDRERRDRSRAKLDEICEQIGDLLPEHQRILRAMLSTQ